ncbi:MAG: hypothetical protein GEEBNDBF_02642 [bacterium]|nr:hypothetical protein [bacterium]
MRCRHRAGFTLVELLVVITIIGILAALALPNFTKARIKAKETEVKANLHSIQTSVERFYVDNEQYPHYIAGGTAPGWQMFFNRLSVSDANHAQLVDPLIINGYVDAYPRNPFVSEGQTIVVASGGIETDPGSGDPRFGPNGLSMGNIMDDTRFYNDVTNPNEYGRMFSWSRRGAAADNRDTPYPAGGLKNMANGQEVFVANWWPGNFFYRAVGPVDFSTPHPSRNVENPPERWSYYTTRYESYILGGYGDKTTNGADVVRMRIAGNDIYYRQPPTTGSTYPNVALTNNQGTFSSLPEVMGGGDADNNPYFPYVKVSLRSDNTAEATEEYAYGAPDGAPDGIVQVFTPAGETQTF